MSIICPFLIEPKETRIQLTLNLDERDLGHLGNSLDERKVPKNKSRNRSLQCSHNLHAYKRILASP